MWPPNIPETPNIFKKIKQQADEIQKSVLLTILTFKAEIYFRKLNVEIDNQLSIHSHLGPSKKSMPRAITFGDANAFLADLSESIFPKQPWINPSTEFLESIEESTFYSNLIL